jgi:predicted ATPase
MITHLHVENFKCLRDMSVDLGAFTVLIGANDSGKSSILDAIHVLGRTVHEPIEASLTPDESESTNVFEELVWRRDAERKIGLAIKGTSGEKTFAYDVLLRAGPVVDGEAVEINENHVRLDDSNDGRYTRFNRTIRTKPPSLQPLVPGFASSAKYRFEPVALREVSPLASRPRLSRTGDNLPEAMDAIFTGPDRKAIPNIESALHAAVPTLSGISLRTFQHRDSNKIGKTLEFVLAGTNPPITIPTSQASEGALLLTAYLTLAYGDTPEILLIEEPENGLHPTRLETVIDLLRKISTGAVGNRPRQVIMTTHSPLLLNYIKSEEVRIVRRDPERGTEVTPMTAVPNLDRMLQEFAVGELWYLLTEEGLLKGEQP